MADQPSIGSLDTLVRTIRTERVRLAAHPADLASIALNGLAERAVPWPEIQRLFRPGPRARPLLRWQAQIEEDRALVTHERDREITVCVARSDDIVAGTRQGELLVWGRDGAIAPASMSWDGRHVAPVSLLCLADDQKTLISAGADGSCFLWTATLERPLARYEGHATEITAAAFDAKRRLLVAGARDGSLRVWTRDPRRAHATLVGHTASVTSVSFCPDSQHLVSASEDGTLRAWETFSGRCLSTLRGHAAAVTACMFLPASATDAGDPRILSGSRDGSLKLWTREGQIVATLGAHDGPVTDMRMYSRRSNRPVTVVTSSTDGTVRIWNLQKEREERALRLRAPALQASTYGFEPRIVGIGADGTCAIWNGDTGALVREFAIDGGSRAQLSVSADGRLAACATETGVLARIDMTLAAETSYPRVALDTAGDRVLTASGSGVHIREWRLPNSPVQAQQSQASSALAALWTGSSYVTLHSGGRLCTWTPDGAQSASHQLPAPTTAIAISPDGSVLVSGDESGKAASWYRDETNVSPGPVFAGGRAMVTACACALNRSAVTGDTKGVLRVWDVSAGAALREISAHSAAILDVDIAHDGSMLLSASADGTLRVWDAEGTLVHDLDAHDDEVTGCWIGSVTSRAISASRDRTIKLWDLRSGRCLETFYGTWPFVSLSVAEDGPVAAAADSSGRVTMLHTLEGFGDSSQLAT